MGDYLAGLLDHALTCEVEGRAADRKTPASIRVEPVRRHRRVAVHDLDLFHPVAEEISGHLRPGGLVALAVRRRARDDLERARRQAAHGRGLPAAGAEADRAEDP